AATSGTNAWAVGYKTSGGVASTLVLHWNGASWKVQASPNAGSRTDVKTVAAVSSTCATYAVAASFTDAELGPLALHCHCTSATNAWAAGDYSNGTSDQTLVLHWNGTAWKVQPTPNEGTMDNDLFGVAATSAGNAWAVGSTLIDGVLRTVALHCC